MLNGTDTEGLVHGYSFLPHGADAFNRKMNDRVMSTGRQEIVSCE